MKPAEVIILHKQFEQEIEPLKGNDLIDKYIGFQGSDASKEPDLGLLKSHSLEAALMKFFGIGYRKAVDARKKEVADAAGAKRQA